METFCNGRIWYLNDRFITYTTLSEIHGMQARRIPSGAGKFLVLGIFVSLSDAAQRSVVEKNRKASCHTGESSEILF